MEPFARLPLRFDNNLPDMAAVEAALKRGDRGSRRRATRVANLGTFTGYRIGLDIGNGNIGWQVLFERGKLLCFLTAESIADHNAALPSGVPRTQLPDLRQFVPVGVHKFKAREENSGTSFSKVRAKTRAGERLLDARQRRKLHVRQALEAAGLLPRRGEPLTGHTRIAADVLRVHLIDPAFPAHPHDLGRALYRTLRNRGLMKPVGRAGRDEESRFGTAKTEVYRQALAEFDCETVGQFLARCARDANADGRGTIRKRHTPLAEQARNKQKKPKPDSQARSYQVLPFLSPTWPLIQEEATKLRDRQRARVAISDADWAAILQAAEFRRSLKATRPGRCRFFPGEFRCVRALPSFQHFRILEQLGHLRDAEGRALDDERFRRAVGLLSGTERIGVAQLARDLGTDPLHAEDTDKGGRNLVGAITDLALTDALGEAWMELPIAQRDDWVMRFLARRWPSAAGDVPPWTEQDDNDLARDAEAAFGSDAIARMRDRAMEALNKQDKFADLSVKAARIQAESYARRLDHQARMQALLDAGAQAPTLDLYEELPYYGQAMPDVTVPAAGFAPPERTCEDELLFGRAANPDVHVVLNRLRKVVNEIVRMMGGILPTTCIVEVARSAMSEEAANEHGLKMLEREKLRAAILKKIREIQNGLGRPMPRGPALDKLVDRWKAAIRQNWRDYDGNSIAPSALIDGATYQLDHVSPAAFGAYRENNMFVSRFNQQKGRNRPWERFGDDPAIRPALLAFAKFGLEQRIAVLEDALNSGRPTKPERRKRIGDGLERVRQELRELQDLGTARPDVYTALQRTLSARPESLLHGESAGADEPGKQGSKRPFDRADQAALFCRFGPQTGKPQQEYAARDKPNIGWSTKLALRYLRHLGAEVDVARPRDSYALRCMYGIEKPRQDLRNHAVDAFLAAHFDGRVLRPVFDHLRQLRLPFEELYERRSLRCAAEPVSGAQEFIDQLERNLVALCAALPFVATAHRPDHRWDPGDPIGGTFGAFGGENIYAFRPTVEERRTLTRLVAKHRKEAEPGVPLSRAELLRLALAEEEGADKALGKKLREEAEVRYVQHGAEGRKPTSIKMSVALPIRSQPGAFLNAEAKFAVSGAAKKSDRCVIGVADFAALAPDLIDRQFTALGPLFRSGDTIRHSDVALVVTGLLADTRVIAYPIDEAMRNPEQKVRPVATPEIQRLSIDVLGRRLHRLRKDTGGLQPVPYPLRGE